MGLTNDERSSLVELRLEKQKTATMNEKNAQEACKANISNYSPYYYFASSLFSAGSQPVYLY